jgi:hypothetical protein
MITERFTVKISIPLKSGARAEAELKIGDQGDSLSMSQAMDLCKTLRSAAAAGEVEIYTNVISTKIDDNWRQPT